MPLSHFWWALLVLSSLGSSLDQHKDSIQKDSVQGYDQLGSFYQAVELASPELQELRSSFDILREQYHSLTLDDMLANFDKYQDEEFNEEMGKEEKAWQETTKDWIRGIDANWGKNGVTQRMPELGSNNVTAVDASKAQEAKQQEKKLEVIGVESKVEKDSLTKTRASWLEHEASVIKGKVENVSKNIDEAVKLLPEATDKLLVHQDIVAHKRHRAKRSLEDNQQEQQNHQEQQNQQEPSMVAKHRAQLMDDFEDHNGNRANFGILGNGLLTPDAEELSGRSMSFPSHEQLAHYNEPETSHGEADSVAHFYDPTKKNMPLINKRNCGVAPQQSVQQQQQQHAPQSRASNFRASFNLNHFFNELQKMQNAQRSQPPQLQQPAQPVQPAPVQQYQQPVQVPMLQPVPQSPIKSVWSPFKPSVTYSNKQQGINFDPNCPPVTMLTTCYPILPTVASIPYPTVGFTPPYPTVVFTAPSPAAPVTPSSPAAAVTPSSPAPEAAISTPTATTEIGNACNNPDAMKMKVDINAHVCGDPKTKLFSGNGSISVQPAPYRQLCSESIYQSQPDHGVKARLNKDLRHPRNVFNKRPIHAREIQQEDTKPRSRIKAPAMKWPGKHRAKVPKTAQQVPSKSPRRGQNGASKCPRPEDKPISFDKLISGKLSEEIVDAVFEAVNSDPELEGMLPVLQRNRQSSEKECKNFYQIRNEKNDRFLSQTEGMVRDTMEAISEIIDQQVHSRSCIPLRPDLAEFYELILQSADEEEKVREKRQSSLRVLAEDFTEDVRLLDPAKINEKTRIVKKLLGQYEDLPLVDQLAAAKVHEELVLDLEYLHKMADTAQRRQRNARLQEVLKQEKLDDALEEHMNTEYSPRFIKLLKTAELFKESGEQQAKDLI